MCRYAWKTYKSHFASFDCRKTFKQTARQFAICLALCFITKITFSQFVIKLRSPQNRQHDYQLVNPSDSVFIEVGHSEDMDVHYNQFYALKESIADGQYDVFVDDTLRFRAFIKNKQKDSTWITFFPNGRLQSLTRYSAGKRNGKQEDFYNNGAIQRKSLFQNDCPVGEIIAFFQNGKIEAKSYYDNCVYIRQEVYDQKGNLKFIHDPKTGTTIKK